MTMPNSQSAAADTPALDGRRLLVAGGGTGGHIYPGLAVAAEWAAAGGTAAFAGVPGNLEARLAPAAGYAFYPVEVRGLTRGRSLSARLGALRALLLLLTLAPLREALSAIRRYRPDVVLGCGGYVSGPVLLAARLKHIPTMILQIDIGVGLANQLAGRFVDCIGVALPEAGERFARQGAVRVVGNPVRSEIISASRQDGIKAFGLDESRQTILAFGGSLGSRAINEALVGALRILLARPDWAATRQVLHVTGKNNLISLDSAEAERAGLKLVAPPYCDRMPLAYAAADLAICRSGATTAAELTARGLPAILIPWAGAAENHQEGNARVLERRGAARVILDSDLSPERLASELDGLISAPGRLRDMATASRAAGIPNAASLAVQELARLAG
jgi:UDP-N-acetylglucosamine--N-acetylmuramyl-(pentapeptide) pyrophosphoryl-undecaprenol N-acetylglucosamine transferase